MKKFDMQKILEEILSEVEPLIGKGSVANYIPALAVVDPTRFGMAVATVDGELYTVGDATSSFSVQSIAKVFTLAQAFKLQNDVLWDRVGRENAGSNLNSLLQLEFKAGEPRNPLTNAGAIVSTDIVLTAFGQRTKDELLGFFRKRSGNSEIEFNEEIAQLEIEHGHRTKALAHLIASFKNMENHPQTVSALYFYQCAMEANCADLARSMLFLANKGKCPVSNEQVLTASQAKRVNAIMLTCGHYDASGDFAFRVGLPAKSGISGAIVAIVPGKMAVAAYSPALNKDGLSMVASDALERFAAKTGFSIF